MSSKLTDLTALTSLTTDDVFYVVNDPDGTPVSRKITHQNMISNILKIGNPVSGGTANSVLYIDSSGNLAQNNPGFTYIPPDLLLSAGAKIIFGTTLPFLKEEAGKFTIAARAGGEDLIVDSSGNVQIPNDDTVLCLGGAQDGTIGHDGSALTITANAVTATDALEFTAGSYEFKVPADTDIVLNFTGTTNSGLFTWMEDEDYFDFADTMHIGDGTNYTEIGNTGDIVFVGGAGLPFGNFYLNEGSLTVAVAAMNIYYEINDVASPSLTVGNLHNITFSDHYLDVGSYSGFYLVVWSTSVQTTTASDEISATIMVDGVADLSSTNHATQPSANKEVSLSGNTIVDLTANKQVSLSVANHTATRDILVSHVNLSITQIGGT